MSNENTILHAILSLTERCFQKSLDEINKLKVDATSRQQIYCACLYCRILELMGDSLHLVKFERLVGLPIILRSMLESLAGIRYLQKSPDNWKAIFANSLKQQRKLCAAAIKCPTNPFLKILPATGDVTKRQSEIESELRQNKDQGYAPISIDKIFEEADMSDEYNSLYPILCMGTHTNIFNLESRYIHIADEHIQIRIHEPQNAQDLCGDISFLLDTLIISSEIIHAMLNTGISFKEEKALLERLVNAYAVEILGTH